MIYLGKNAVGISDTVQVVPEDIVNRVNAVEIKETVSTPSDILTIYDGAKDIPVDELIVGIEPLQDLHGYDSPWPGGGGKNLFNINAVQADPSSTENSYLTKRIFTPGTYCVGSSASNYYSPQSVSSYSISNGTIFVQISTNGYGVCYPLKLEAGVRYITSGNINEYGIVDYAYYDAEGNFLYANQNVANSAIIIPQNTDITVIVFKPNTTNVTATFSNVQVEQNSSATTYAPYENICPISGSTSCNISRTGLNLLENISKTNGKFLNAYGVEANDPNFWYTDLIPVEIGKTYYFTGKSTINGASNRRIHEYDSSGTWIRQATYVGVTNNGSYNLDCTIPSGTTYIKVSYGINDEYATLADIQNDTYPISWQSEAGIVYGGELNVTTGELVIEWTKYRMPMLTSSNAIIAYDTYIKSDACDFFIRPDIAPYPSTGPSAQTYTPLCNRLIFANKDIWINTGYKNTFTINANQIHINISNELLGITDYTQETQSTAKEKVIEYFNNLYNSENYFEFVYKIAPQTYQLTASQITTLLGTNHIWADTGDILSLTYSADPKMYVDQNSVSDVQVNGTSVVQDGVANVPIALNNGPLGLVKISSTYGLNTYSNGVIRIWGAGESEAKGGTNESRSVVPAHQHESVFYGLAKIAGADEKNSDLPAGQYTETAKSKISDMLSAPVTVSGITPSITALPGVRYICGECSTLSITVPESGIIDVTFTSGSTATVLTVTPPTGMTMKWIGEDPTALEANKTYEINIKDGCLGMVVSWT